MRATCFSLCLAAVASFQLPHAAPRTAGLRSMVIASETEVEQKRASDIFTLEERDDGWDDVRQSIKEAKKQRQQPWEDINRDYIGPTTRWAKVIAEEVGGLAKGVSGVELKAPDLKAPELSADPLKVGLSVLDSIGDRRQAAKEAEAKKKADAKAKAMAKAKPAEVSPTNALGSAANLGLLLGVPVATLYLISTFLAS